MHRVKTHDVYISSNTVFIFSVVSHLEFILSLTSLYLKIFFLTFIHVLTFQALLMSANGFAKGMWWIRELIYVFNDCSPSTVICFLGLFLFI